MIAKKLSIKYCPVSCLEKLADSHHKLISDKLAKQKEFEKRSEKFEKMKKSEKVGHLEAEMMSKIRVGLDSIALNDKHREALYAMVSIPSSLFSITQYAYQLEVFFAPHYFYCHVMRCEHNKITLNSLLEQV